MRNLEPLSIITQPQRLTVDGTSHGSLKPTDRRKMAFKSVLTESTARDGPPQAPRARGEVSDIAFEKLRNYFEHWSGLSSKVQSLVAQVPSGSRPYIEAQFLVHRLELETNLFVRAGEALSNTVKRVQGLSA